MGKTKTRGNGDGTIYYDDKRKRYVGQITIGRTESGKLKRKSVFGKTKKEVKSKLDSVRYELQTGLYCEPSQITVDNFTLNLLNEDWRLNLITDGTYYRKLSTYKRIAKSNLGQSPLQKVTEKTVKEYLYGITNNSTSVIKKDFELLRRCMDEAVKRNIISVNPMLNIRRPRSSCAEVKTRALTIDEESKLLQVLNNNDKIKYIPQMKLMMFTGMRMGEINALSVSDINFDFKTISINRTITKSTVATPIIGKSTKTKAGQRVIPVSEPVLAFLKNCIEDYTPNPENLLFYDTERDKPISTTRVNFALQTVLKKYDIIDNTIQGKVSLHSLRHTYATRCIEAGVQIKVLQQFLGHTDIRVTINTYCDAFNDCQQDNIALVEDYMSKKLSV